MSDPSYAATGGRAPGDNEDIRKVFDNHYCYFQDKDGEIAHQQTSDESAIRREYSGRMVFELLQNAIDRAKDTVEVRFRETGDEQYAYELIVANDGVPVRIAENYPYDDPPDANDSDAKRPDFNALCSLHTSNKSQDQSIGTKGSGFRSVFSIGTHVQVWSRFEERDDWWGLEMHSPMAKSTWKTRADHPDIVQGIEHFLSSSGEPPMEGDEERPSYHFPIPLSADQPLSMLSKSGSLSTGVIVPVPADVKSHIQSSFDQLQANHLYFTGLAEGNSGITVDFDRLDSHDTKTTDPPQPASPGEHEPTWALLDWRIDDATSELSTQAAKADLDITYPGAAIAWPDSHHAHEMSAEEPPDTEPAVYGYLPTDIAGPFGADFHGDFKLSIDRTNIRFRDEIIGEYNTRIAKIGAELHVLAAASGVPELVEAIDWDVIDPDDVNQSLPTSTLDRPDFWRFLNPDNATSKAGDIVVDKVADLFFDPDARGSDHGKFRLWAELAAAFFAQREEWPLETYESFWETNLQWVDYVYGGERRLKTWREIAERMCDAFRETDAAVAPIVEGDDATSAVATALPLSPAAAAAGGSTERKDSALYIWDPDKDDFELSMEFDLPDVLKADDRVVTTYGFDDKLYTKSPNPLGATEFTRWQVLDELRQLPNSPSRIAAHASHSLTGGDGADVVARQCELIRFAAQLYRLDTGGTQEIPANSGKYTMGWRMRDSVSGNAKRAGRSIATLFLPMNEAGETDADSHRWAPARQLTRDEVAVDRLRPLPEDLDIDGFLTFLGVAPRSPDDVGVPLTLVEGGADGCVAPQETPPPLAPAEVGPEDATFAELRAANQPVSDPDAWRQSIQAAYDEWLEPVISIEHEAAATEDEADDESETVDCWTNIVATLGDWPWYPVTDDDDDEGTVPPVVSNDPDTAVRPSRITVHQSRQTRFPKLLYGLIDDAESAELLIALDAIDGLDAAYLRSDKAARAYRLLEFLTEMTPSDIDTLSLQQNLVSLYTRVLTSIIRGDPDGHNREELSVLMYESGASGMALTDRRLAWASSGVEAWIAADRADLRTIHQYFPTIPLVAAPVAPTHFDDADPFAKRTISLNDKVVLEPEGGISDDITDDLFNQLSDLIPRLLALADATSTTSIDRSSLTDHWGPDRIRRAETLSHELTVVFDDGGRTEQASADTHGEVMITRSEPKRIVFESPDDAKRPPLDAFGEALSELLVDHSVSDLFARALHKAEDGEDQLDTFVAARDAASLVPTYQSEFDPLTSKEHDILVEQTTEALAKLGLSLETTTASQLRILRVDDIKPIETPESDTEEPLTEAAINRELSKIELPDTRDWSGYRPQFRCIDSHYSAWQTWFENRETWLLAYLQKFLEKQGRTEFSDASLADALDEHAKTEVCPRIRFALKDVVPSWLAFEGVEDVPDSETFLEQAKQYKSSFDPVTDVKDMEELDISPGEINEVTIDPKAESGSLSADEAVRTKRAQMAYGESAEQAALTKIADITIAALATLNGDQDIHTIFGTPVTDLQDAIEVLCWPFYEGGVTETHIRKHMTEYAAEGDRTALEKALHISTVWDGAGFDIIGLTCSDGQLYPVRYEIKSLSDLDSSTIAHLSQKQYAVYKEIHNGEATDRALAGDWRLYGVTEDSIAVDITHWLEKLPDDALDSLRKHGIEPDGLILSTGELSNPESE